MWHICKSEGAARRINNRHIVVPIRRVVRNLLFGLDTAERLDRAAALDKLVLFDHAPIPHPLLEDKVQDSQSRSTTNTTDTPRNGLV